MEVELHLRARPRSPTSHTQPRSPSVQVVGAALEPLGTTDATIARHAMMVLFGPTESRITTFVAVSVVLRFDTVTL